MSDTYRDFKDRNASHNWTAASVSDPDAATCRACGVTVTGDDMKLQPLLTIDACRGPKRAS